MSNYPAIPEPQLTLESVRESILALKEAFENLVGTRGPDSTTVATATSVGSLLTAQDEELRALIAASTFGLVSDVTAGSPLASSGGDTPNITLNAEVPATLGGTGLVSPTANRLLLANGASPMQLLAPGTTGNVVTSNGTTFVSSAPPAAWPWTRNYKTADQARTSSTTLTDITDLSFAVTSGVKYYFRSFVMITSGVGGFNFTVNGPTASKLFFGQPNAAGATVYNTIVLTTGAGTAVTVVTNLHGFVIPSANGTVTLRFSQWVSNVSPTTVFSDSYIEWMALP